MGIFRTLYREARDIIGLKPPAENESQLAERVCGEVKSEVGGKRTQEGDDYKLALQIDGRDVVITFEAAGSRAYFDITSSLEEGPTFVVNFDPSGGKDQPPKGTIRKGVATGCYVEGTAAEASTQEQLFKALPTGTRAALASLVQKTKGTFGYDEGAFRFVPETPTLSGPSAKYNVKTHLTTLMQLVNDIETAWNAL